MTRKSIGHLLCCAAVLLVAGCGGESDQAAPASTVAEQVASLEASGAIPVLDRSASVAGPDTNSNGIRDDVDAYIDRQGYTAPQRSAAQQLAKATQRAVTVDPTIKAQVEAVSLADARAVRCAFVRFGSGSPAASQAAENIEKVTTNTKARLLAYLAYAKALDGSVLPSPEGDTCD